MSSSLGSLSDLKNLFPTKTHFVIFVGYMALFINQGSRNFLDVVSMSCTVRWYLVVISQPNQLASSTSVIINQSFLTQEYL